MNFTTEDAKKIHEECNEAQARRLHKWCLADVEVSYMFPQDARQNRGYLNLILRCKCGYSPTVHYTKQYPPGRPYYKCGSTDIGNQCDFFVYKEQFNHTVYDLCCCEQPFKLSYDTKKRRKFLCCPYYPTDEGCVLTYDSRHYPQLR